MIRFNMFDSSCHESVARLSKMYHSILSGGSNWEQLESMICLRTLVFSLQKYY